jgi:hypothetical protein
MFRPLATRYYNVTDNSTTIDPSPTVEITYTRSSNGHHEVRREVIVISNSIPSEPELDFGEIRVPEKHKLFLKPRVPVRQAPWQAKWRLRQQRPRDGLHS